MNDDLSWAFKQLRVVVALPMHEKHALIKQFTPKQKLSYYCALAIVLTAVLSTLFLIVSVVVGAAVSSARTASPTRVAAAGVSMKTCEFFAHVKVKGARSNYTRPITVAECREGAQYMNESEEDFVRFQVMQTCLRDVHTDVERMAKCGGPPLH
jgi:hypothetical protein